MDVVEAKFESFLDVAPEQDYYAEQVILVVNHECNEISAS